MNDLNILSEQMVEDISSQALHLDDLRLKLFTEWLKAHSSKVAALPNPHTQAELQVQMDVAFAQDGNMGEQFKVSLMMWFEALPMQGMLREYRLILDEIAWWRDLDEMRLKNFMNHS